MPAVTRRRFLGGLFLGAAAVVAGGVWWSRRDDASPALEAFFSDPDGAVRLGREYLDADPAEADHLLDGIAPSDADPREWLAGASAGEFATAVRAAVADDWEAGRQVSVLGWYLAPSSARACALLAQERGAGASAA